MSAHTHRTHVDGCFRCDLSRDEVVSEEVVEAVAPLARRLAEEAPAAAYLYVGSGYALVRESFNGGAA